MPSIMGITQSAFDPASRVRFIQFMPGLKEGGWEVVHRPNHPDRQWMSPLKPRILRGAHYRAGRLVMKANRWSDVRRAGEFDLVFVNRDLAGGGLFFERRLLENNPRVVFDFDDAIFIGKNEYAVRWMCEHAAWVTPGNAYLAEFARKSSDHVTIIPTVVDTDRYAVRKYGAQEKGRKIRVGWSGSDRSVPPSLYPYLNMLVNLQRKLDFEFVVITNSRPRFPNPDLRFTFHEWNAEDEYNLESTMDIGLMPLVDEEFQRGKCGLKLLQYMAAAIPTVGSPVGVNKDIIAHGTTGFLATTEKEWEDALAELIQSASLRSSMGTAGRRVCVDQWSITRWLPELSAIFNRVRNGRR